jgi:hypothetical protein
VKAQTLPDPHIYLSPDAMFFACVLAWSLFGLWTYLCAKRFDEDGWFTTLWCGPAAWVAAAWFFVHRRLFTMKKTIIPKRKWETPINERWKN